MPPPPYISLPSISVIASLLIMEPPYILKVTLGTLESLEPVTLTPPPVPRPFVHSVITPPYILNVLSPYSVKEAVLIPTPPPRVLLVRLLLTPFIVTPSYTFTVPPTILIIGSLRLFLVASSVNVLPSSPSLLPRFSVPPVVVIDPDSF